MKIRRTGLSARARGTALGITVAGAAAAALAGSALTASASGHQARSHSSGSEPTFIVGQQDSGIVSLVADSGALKGAPYQVKFDLFPDGPPEIAAAAANKLDLADLGDVPPISGASKNLPFKLIAAELPPSYKQVGDYIIVPKGSSITKVSQLKGKTIAVPYGTSANGYVLDAIEAAGLTPTSGKPNSVTLDNLTPASAQTAFQAGDVAALGLWNPQIAVDLGEGAKVIGYGRPPLDPDVSFYIADTKDLSNSDPTRKADLINLLERLGAAYQWGDAHPAQWEAGLEHETGINAATAKIDVTNGYVEIRYITPQVVANVQVLANTFYNTKQISQKVDVASYVDNVLSKSYDGQLP